MADESGAITAALARLNAGDAEAADELMPLVYQELRALARGYFSSQRPNHTLQPTALVHEAFIRLAQTDMSINDRAHFFAVAATAMRQILAEHARRKNALKRGGGATPATWTAQISDDGDSVVDLIALDRVLSRLEALSPRQARIVECRFFAGMTVAEVAVALGVSTATVEKEWRRSKAWLTVELQPAG